MSDAPDRPTLAAIAAVFARYANATFGGGSATIAVLRRQLVERRAWLTEPDFELAYALSRLTPGTNLLAFCTASGFRRRGWLGGVVALLASSIPCSLLAVLVTVFYEQLHGNAYFGAALGGAVAAAVAIMLATAWTFAQPHVEAAPRKTLVVVPLVAALALGVHVSPILLLLLAAAIGLAWPP